MAKKPLVYCPQCGKLHRNNPHDPHLAGNRNYQDERQRAAILRQWRNTHGNICPGTPWCKTPNIPHPCDDLTVDHVKPKAAGGTLADGWRIICRWGNTSRGNGRPGRP